MEYDNVEQVIDENRRRGRPRIRRTSEEEREKDSRNVRGIMSIIIQIHWNLIIIR